MKNNNLSKILKLANDLTKQELMSLNHSIISLIKVQQDVAIKKAAIVFTKGDIVSFQDSSGEQLHGVVTKKNPKTLQVTTPDNYYVNIPATYLDRVNNPSKKLIDFRKRISPTYEEMHQVLEEEINEGTFH
jgi:hypothetical protein